MQAADTLVAANNKKKSDKKEKRAKKEKRERGEESDSSHGAEKKASTSSFNNIAYLGRSLPLFPTNFDLLVHSGKSFKNWSGFQEACQAPGSG